MSDYELLTVVLMILGIVVSILIAYINQSPPPVLRVAVAGFGIGLIVLRLGMEVHNLAKPWNFAKKFSFAEKYGGYAK